MRDLITDLVKRYCPHGHEMILSHYVWTNFLFHRCKTCKTMYNFNELTSEEPS